VSRFLEAVRQRILIFDGAMGTMLQERGLAAGGCPEEMNLQQPEVVTGIHGEYVAAGADIIEANTFGGSRSKLAHYGLEDRVAEINRRGVELARAAAGPETFVAGSVGPTGRFMEPVGDAAFHEMTEIFAEQIAALAGAGADLINFETFLDIRELRAAVIACRDVCRLPISAQMTFDDAGRTVLGTPPEAAAVTLDALQVDLLGSNCGLGIDGLFEILQAMRSVSSRPLIAQANAGLPVLKNGATIFPATPEDMTIYHSRLAELGVRVIGGCCGTTPQHIRAMREALSDLDLGWAPPSRRGCLSSRTAWLEIGDEAPCALIGERINPTGKKAYSAELRAGQTAYIRNEARAQTDAGADLLDLNCGLPGIDESAALERAVFAVSGTVSTPLVLDTADPSALERGLQAAEGKVLINSVTGEASSLERILPLARRYGAALIGLTLDEEGIPETAEGRLAIARRIRDAVRQAGLPDQDLVIDCLTLTVSAEPIERRICVFDIAGASGPAMNAMKDWRAEALKWGLKADLVPYTNEGVAAEELKSENCDAALLSGIRARLFNRYVGTLDSVGGVPSMKHMRLLLKVLSHPSQADKMSNGNYEVMGIAPAGAAYVFVDDRKINSLSKAAGKKVAVLSYDETQAQLVAQVGATPVPSNITDFSSKFNNGVVDVIVAPLAAYNALELYKGLQPDGGIIDYPLAQISFQLVAHDDLFPAKMAQKSREYFFANLEQTINTLNQEARAVPDKWWVQIPQADKQEYRTMMQEARVQLREQGYYSAEMLKLQRKVRCKLNPSHAECTSGQE